MFRVLIFAILFTSQLLAGYDDLGTRLYIDSKEGYHLEALVFGINAEATNYLDTALGEAELPPFPPPEGIHAGFMFLDTTQDETIMSYKDFRPYPENIGDTVKYQLQVYKGAGDIITLSWHPLGPEINSAIIVDKLTLGKLVLVDMKDSTKATIDNEFIERFEIWVVYEPTTAVERQENFTDLNMFPAEFTDRITIKGDSKYLNFKVYNIFGSLVKSGVLEAGYAEINFNAAAPGIYFIAVFDNKGNKKVRKVIKS